MNYILDTNIITAHMENNEKVRMKLGEIAFYEEEVFISAIRCYEIKRGLLVKNATRKLDIFEGFCREIRILFLDNQEIFDKASDIWADLEQKGRHVNDADTLIAATALTQDLLVVSDDSDFLRIQDITVENWLNLEP
ncbi:MAG: twitching motility protein PilT [Theionarchaea archaeon DG-70-1]|nr:MAG: twitching motility protein PilT [Theionarchaea archaeon DG-70-1]